ncbi:hypothetical protein C8R45DRAFT_921957 [Mycena sanguinolenta]|nr:hypothetical protein C8R45DRAFT_921957 [Mycena sanguinolenta]
MKNEIQSKQPRCRGPGFTAIEREKVGCVIDSEQAAKLKCDSVYIMDSCRNSRVHAAAVQGSPAINSIWTASRAQCLSFGTNGKASSAPAVFNHADHSRVGVP